MDNILSFRNQLDNSPLQPIVTPLLDSLQTAMKLRTQGDQAKWDAIVDALPSVSSSGNNFTQQVVKIGKSSDIDNRIRERLESALHKFHPWRKGPFNIFGIEIDSEWRSNLKWARLENKIRSLKDKRVLDVGCGNGYYMFRMLGAGAEYVLGIDPTQLFNAQFKVLTKFIPESSLCMLPLRCEELPFHSIEKNDVQFDTVFSMGILYHRKDPKTHLQELSRCLKLGGELIIETLMFDSDIDNKFTPDKTYSKMRNVWCIPTEEKLHRMLCEAGYCNVTTIDISVTTIEEQRKTDWMTCESLSDFLDPADNAKTIEGFPAPKRIMVTASKLK